MVEVGWADCLALQDGEVDLDLVDQHACTRRWTKIAFGQVALTRSIERCPGCEEPFSTTQNTRLAKA